MLTLWRAPRRNGSQLPQRSPWSDFDQLFDTVLESFPAAPAPFGASVGGPSADVLETENAYRVQIDLPGVEQKDIEVKIDGGILTVKAERKPDGEEKSESYLRSERSYGVLTRSFSLPEEVDASKVEAKHLNGVLTLTLPKREEAKPRTINVAVK